MIASTKVTTLFALFRKLFRKLAVSCSWPVLGSLLFFSSLQPARATLQFDVFLGFDGIVPEAGWFPVVCEIKNDGPPFMAYVEISAQFGQSQVRRVPIELPTNTRKRIVVPVFSSSRYARWECRLLDDRDRVRAGQDNIRPRAESPWHMPLTAALSRTMGGLPAFPKVRASSAELQPLAARLLPAIFPDNPIALDSLGMLYLNSETALNLNPAQANAILTWLNSGGHLVVGVEQIADITGNAWLSPILPVEFSRVEYVQPKNQLEQWLHQETPSHLDRPSPAAIEAARRSRRPAALSSVTWTNIPLTNDAVFAEASLQLGAGPLRDGRVLAAAGDLPLIIEADRGMGRITVLTFTPEREPFLSWKNAGWLWARLAEVPPGVFDVELQQHHSYRLNTDGIFGALIDSKQVRKLPVSWLVSLLVVYLLVIGPFDRFVLRRLNRQMLTWITFPCYVVFFSGLIYFIGFQLRAGESEYNEVHIVDVLPAGPRAVLRGQTYASIYSPAKATYPLKGEQPFAAFRGEFAGGRREGDSSRSLIFCEGNNYHARVSVPVWTSQLYVSDWLQPAPAPIGVRINRSPQGWSLSVENHLDRTLTQAHIVLNGRIHSLGDLPPNQATAFQVEGRSGRALKDFVRQHSGGLYEAVQQRQYAFGSTPREISDPVSALIATSFVSQLDADMHMGERRFMSPKGLDLSAHADRGCAILLAWDAGDSVAPSLNQFAPRRNHRDTLLRLTVPLNPEP